MAAVVTDLIRSASVSEDSSGVTATRVFQVSDLTGPAAARLANARAAAGVPRRGDTHPGIPDIRADVISVDPQDLTKAVVTVTYRALNGLDVIGAAPVISVGTTLTTITSSRDVNGDQVIIPHTVEEFDGDGNLTNVRQERQVGSFQKQIPTTVVVYERKEERPPVEAAERYVGRVGDIGPGRAIGPGGYTWLCTRVEGSTNDGGLTWDCKYEFQYAADGWAAVLDPIDPTTGQPYVNGTPVYVPIYRAAGFLGGLNLPRIDWPLTQQLNA